MKGSAVVAAPTPPGSELARSLGRGVGLYIHIPFCQTKCPYCDFNTYAGIEGLLPSYLGALATELRLWGALLGHPQVGTIFLGGGTPSLLNPEQLQTVLTAVHEAFAVQRDAEVTTEVNPDDVTVSRFQGFLDLGVNRISMGVQSLEPDLLQLLGRRHTADQAISSYHRLREAGFRNINMDLMYGLPFQDLAQWQDTLTGVIDLAPEHLSAYCLTLEAGTPMEQQMRAGSLPEPDPDLAAIMYEWAEDHLASRGYLGYEISNWARPGFESRHNVMYWKNLPYLGVGPGAHSYLAGHRFAILASPRDYIRRVGRWADRGVAGAEELSTALLQDVPTVASVETIDATMEMSETLIMGLRLHAGVRLADFEARFHRGLLDVYGVQVEEVVDADLVEMIGEGAARLIRLTPRGRLLGNQVFYRFTDIAVRGGVDAPGGS
jgi:oxygen-independent coproporphyrinogen-3 oxidase